MKFDVVNRWSGNVQFTAEIECDETSNASIKLGLAIKWACKADANLTCANLACANLADANLAGANLTGANLADANLTGANLTGANLMCANLMCANLTCANLACANLACANLADANLTGAYLARANLTGADLARANLTGADLARAGSIEDKDIPVIPKIDAVILSKIEEGGTLNMDRWHGPDGWCGTSHCRAGWAVHCAGKPGRALEERVGTKSAATMIYRNSRPGIPTPWFFAATEAALADIRKCAAEQLAAKE